MARILLHVCCAPCATHPVELLAAKGEVIGYFANPNIQPKEEYEKRLDEAQRFFDWIGIPLEVEIYDPESWDRAVAGFEKEPEGGRRCEICFRHRLTSAAKKAKNIDCEYFTTTLTVSRYKNSKVIHRVGEEVSKQMGVIFRKDDFKKRGGYDRSIELSKKWGLYRQDYCGCIYSKEERFKKSALKGN